jgi:hypothetical protein
MRQFGDRYTDDEVERLSSNDGKREAQVMGSACASRLTSARCGDLLQELNRALGSIVMNAQVMQWKLPAYSHSKRYVREMERSAQRGASLVSQLVRCLEGTGQGEDELCGEAPHLAGADVAVTAQEPNPGGANLANQPRTLLAHAAPAFSRSRAGRSHTTV